MPILVHPDSPSIWYGSIEEAVVDGIRDMIFGGQLRQEDIGSLCKEHIAHYKAPEGVEFVESLPENPQGKILKRETRSKYCKQQSLNAFSVAQLVCVSMIDI